VPLHEARQHPLSAREPRRAGTSPHCTWIDARGRWVASGRASGSFGSVRLEKRLRVTLRRDRVRTTASSRHAPGLDVFGQTRAMGAQQKNSRHRAFNSPAT
jgi:hypothetical protein